MCGTITKTIKNISRTHCNFLEIFARNLTCIEVQIAKTGVYSKKIKGKKKSAQSPRFHSLNPRYWWIQIKLTLQERWIDPVSSGSWSKGPHAREVDRVRTDPFHQLYKRSRIRIPSFPNMFLFLLLLLSPISPNPNPSFTNSIQKWPKCASKCSCS